MKKTTFNPQPGSALTMADALSPEDSEKMKKIRERSRAKKEKAKPKKAVS